ncbi:MAG: hypothetical protein AAF797_17620 [Planctomycetota bacterium]
MDLFQAKHPLLPDLQRLLIGSLESTIASLRGGGRAAGASSPRAGKSVSKKKPGRASTGKASPRQADAWRGLLRVRAVLDLMGPSLDAELWVYERGALAQAIGPLAASRRASAAVGLMKSEKSPPKAAGQGGASAWGIVRKTLDRSASSPSVLALTQGQTLNPTVYRLIADLAEARARAVRLPGLKADRQTHTPDDQVLRDGLTATLRAVRRRDRWGRPPTKRRRPNPSDTPELGGALGPCGLLAEQLRLLEPAWPAGIKPLRKLATELADAGSRWWAATLIAGTAARLLQPTEPHAGKTPPDPKQLQAVQAWASQTQQRLTDDAQPALDRLTLETPAALAKRLTGYTQLWRARQR